MAATADKTALLSVYSGRLCLGFVLARGKAGFEAFTANQQSIGVFADQHAAVAAIMQAEQ
jgi:hypothetical protein